MIGPDKGDLKIVKKYIIDNRLSSRVNILGQINNYQLPEIYSSHSVLINTTSYESFGVSLIESAACGTPIISNSVGEIPLIWTDKENILLVKNNEINQYIEQISKIFESEILYNKISINGRKVAEKFNNKKLYKSWRPIFK